MPLDRFLEDCAAVMSGMPAAVTRCSVDLRYRWVSERYATWLGYVPEEIIGKPIADVLGEEGLAAIRPHVDRVLAGHAVEYEELLTFKNIGQRWIHAEYSPTRDESGAVDGWIACVLDITDRKRAEQRLADAHAALARLLDLSVMPGGEGAAPTLLQAVMDAAIDVMAAHKGTLQLYDEATGTLSIVAHRGFERPFLEHFARVHDDSAVCGAALRRRARTIVEDVTTDPLTAGPTREVQRQAGVRAVQATPMVSREGRLLGVISTHWTEPHCPDADRLRILDIVARQAADIIQHREQEEQLRDASRRKDEFLAMLGHELRNPLAPILTATHVMKLRGDGAHEKERSIIERQAKHLVLLVDDLLDVSRITRGTIELRRERVPLADVVAKGIEIASPLLEQRAHRLSVDVPREGLVLDADPARMAQVVGNLLTNAAKYTERGGNIRVVGRASGETITLRVQDDGIGISRVMLARIFEPFVQEMQALDRPRGGLGLGLTIVRSLVELHGGSVAAHSEGVGKGSEFVVTLPGARADARALRPAQQPTPQSAIFAPSLRVLVIDDNEDAAQMLADALEAVGHEVRIAHDGPDALRVVQEFAPGIALVDIGLPVMDGYELARRLRDLPGLADLRLVAVTGYGQESDRRRSKDAGFEDHFVKPVDLERLKAVVTTGAARRSA